MPEELPQQKPCKQQAVRRGKFITLEGGEGLGKTTNLEFIKQTIESYGFEVITTREPGGTALSEAIRGLLLDKQYTGMHRQTELLLVFAARAEHVNSLIEPALQQGKWVVSDRFVDASYAYQGEGRGFGFAAIEELESIVLQGFKPDLTILLDADIELGMGRVAQRKHTDRFEAEKMDFFQRVRKGYLRRAAQQSQICIVDAARELSRVQKDIDTQLQILLDGL